MPRMSLNLSGRLAAFLVLTGSTAAQAAALATCHVTYGGETVDQAVAAVADPHAVPTVAVGSYFLIRFVLQDRPAALAAFKAYAYGARAEVPVLIHQLDVAWPPAVRNTSTRPVRAGGYTGVQRVYEPLTDAELQYWCERTTSRKTR